MAYHIDDAGMTLADLGERLRSTDLVPSRACLLDDLETALAALSAQGIGTVAQLRDHLRTPKRLADLAQATGLDRQYLTQLRREVEGYFPKPAALRACGWLPEEEIAKLEGHGVDDLAALYAETSAAGRRAALAQSSGVEPGVLDALARLADLSRVQWVSPATARWLVEAGYPSATALAAADPEELGEALQRVNHYGRFFKGRIGLRDLKRLVQAARYVED
jgi:predicted flap endonuclease-1-like 5' DNA nuclease